MPYQEDYQYSQYGGYQGYSQMPPQAQTQQDAYANWQSQYQQPQVVIPQQQPRHHVSSAGPSFNDTRYPSQSGHPNFAHNFSQAPQSQYYTAPQQQGQQFYTAPSPQLPQQQHFPAQAFSQPSPQLSSQSLYQQQWQTAPSQQFYSQPVQQAPSRSAALSTQSVPAQCFPQSQSHQNARASNQPLQLPAQSHPRSSPDPLQGPSTLGRGHVSQTGQQYSPQIQSQARPPQQQARSNQPQQFKDRDPPSHRQQQPGAQQQQYQQRPVQQTQQHKVHSQPSQPQQRVATAVEIPLYKQEPYQQHDLDMARSPKRRRSNDGHAVPVCEAQVPLKQKGHLIKQEALPSSSPFTELTSSQMPPTPQPKVDYQAILLSLAEEYLGAAYKMSLSIAAGTGLDQQFETYSALMSSAMACLESVLYNYRHTDPRREARIRLRLATLMIDECENDEEVGAILGKGIDLCDRSRLPDLKYAMHHVSVRSTFQHQPKAALKSLDKLIQEVEDLHMQHWIYAFRLLRVSLALQLGTSSDLSSTLKHLTALDTLADNERHTAAQILIATLSAIVHLLTNASDSIDSVLRATATARSHQLSPEMQALPQIRGLLDSIDVARGLVGCNIDHAHTAMQQMHKNMETKNREPGWSKYGSFEVKLGSCNNKTLEQDTCGILRNSADGNAVLIMRWLSHSQLYALAYALTAITMMSRGPGDTKTDAFLNDGLKMAKLMPDGSKRSLSAIAAQLQQQQRLSILIRLFSTFSLCARFEWDSARQAVDNLQQDLRHCSVDLSQDWCQLLAYLDALSRQGIGDLKGALKLYAGPDLAFSPDNKPHTFGKDLRALATLNSVLILRGPDFEDLVRADALFSTIEPYCFQHPNKALYCAANLAKAISQKTIINTKQHLQRAVTASKEASNSLLMYIAMNVMTSSFFSTAIIGDQAEKSAHAGRVLAKQGRNRLWIAVADGMYGNIKERCGKIEEAETARMEGEGQWGSLPKALQERLMREPPQPPQEGMEGFHRAQSPRVVVEVNARGYS